MVMSERSVNLPTLLLGRLRPPKRLTSTLCTYFRQKLTTALLESAEGETKVCGRTGYRTRALWLLKEKCYDIALSKTLFVVADIPNHSLYAVILLSYRIQIYISRFDFPLDSFCIFILLYMFCLDYCT